MLKPSAEGTVYVRAALKSNPEITDTVEIKIVKEGEDPDKPIEPDKPIDPDKPVDPISQILQTNRELQTVIRSRNRAMEIRQTR